MNAAHRYADIEAIEDLGLDYPPGDHTPDMRKEPVRTAKHITDSRAHDHHKETEN